MFLLISLLLLLVFIISLIWVGKKNNQADWGHWGTNIVDGLIRVYCRSFHRQSFDEILLPEGHITLLAANHISGIDPFILITALRHPVRFMIAKEEYEKPILHWLFRAAGCIPVDRGGRVEGAFRRTLKAIKAGEVVAIFPQGGIHHVDLPREKIKPGLIKLSQLSGCNILPVRISGIGAPGTILQAIIRRSNVKLETHPVITSQQAQEPDFREAMAEWLLAKKDSIF